MATLVSFHAHPDDESIGTGGTMAKATADGHRVVVVFGTRGELGEPVPGVLREGESLWERRVTESAESARVLGASRIEFLGYEDSGMMGEPTNDNPACFWKAELDEAAERLAAILRDEDAEVLTIYDEHGGYGHPDHIQVHRVGVRAAELAGVSRVFEGTMNRDRLLELMAQQPTDGEANPDMEQARQGLEAATFGSAEAQLTHAVDVTLFLEQKRQSMQAHASQIAPDSFFLTMPDEAFVGGFGTEWYIRHGHVRAAGAPFGIDLFTD